MMQVNVLEAKTDLSKLLRLLETKSVDVITIARNGKPIAEMKAVSTKPISNRIGMAKNKIHVPDNFEETNDEIATMLMEGEI